MREERSTYLFSGSTKKKTRSRARAHLFWPTLPSKIGAPLFLAERIPDVALPKPRLLPSFFLKKNPKVKTTLRKASPAFKGVGS